MSGFQNNTNKGRVEKMLDTLALIDKSAKSNKAEASEVTELLAPLMETLQGMAGEAPQGVERTVPAPEDPTPVTPAPQARPRSPREAVKQYGGDPQGLMDLIHIATMELDQYLFENKVTKNRNY